MGSMKADGAIVVKAPVCMVMECEPSNGDGETCKGEENELSLHQDKL
jgi:hypothetical protein